MKLVAAAVLVASFGCGEAMPSSEPVMTVDPSPASARAPATVSARVVAVSDASLRTRMPELGVSIVLPPEITASFDEPRSRYWFRLSDGEEGVVDVVASAAPETDRQAMALWEDAPDTRDHRVIEHGGGGAEPWWAVTSFEVRMGVEGRPGLHRLQRVTRVQSVLAVSPSKHAKCTMFLEYDVERAGRPASLDEAIGVCKSLRPL